MVLGKIDGNITALHVRVAQIGKLLDIGKGTERVDFRGSQVKGRAEQGNTVRLTGEDTVPVTSGNVIHRRNNTGEGGRAELELAA